MSPHRSSALLASAALVLGATLAPATAFADGAAPSDATFTVDDLRDALTAAQATTASAEASGWRLDGTAALGDTQTSVTAIYAVDRDLSSVPGLGSVIDAQSSGTYVTLSTLKHMGLFPVRRALAAIGREDATWLFTTDKSVDLLGSDAATADLDPATTLADLLDETQTELTGTPTETVADDGSATYGFEATHTTDGETATGSLTIDASGLLTAISTATSDETETLAFVYGPQHVDLPSKGVTVTDKQLSLGLMLATLPHQVKSLATQAARMATSASHHHAVKPRTIRSAAGRMVRLIDRHLDTKALSTKSIPGGVRISGVDHRTHIRASYTVVAHGKKALARKG